ncbi:hypothetical protein BDZ90DRAFT_7741 [Jaminaea rosea]|uniref:Uncharacterized protein n=1 Tax=Jaminaea rosea TaxID=1569628 RepID=A0A316UZQ0_9BASI|nr:hypothetical protein BDZ90DRAFT_7741 [Jaminaea rosea]PWN30238.1 hypothetical protein BDZ90DRAFT_7741 [Jaminaea rosea]
MWDLRCAARQPRKPPAPHPGTSPRGRRRAAGTGAIPACAVRSRWLRPRLRHTEAASGSQAQGSSPRQHDGRPASSSCAQLRRRRRALSLRQAHQGEVGQEPELACHRSEAPASAVGGGPNSYRVHSTFWDRHGEAEHPPRCRPAAHHSSACSFTSGSAITRPHCLLCPCEGNKRAPDSVTLLLSSTREKKTRRQLASLLRHLTSHLKPD